LKKRQQKNAAAGPGAPTSSGVASPARTFSPAPSEHVEEEPKDVKDLFAKDNSDTSWLASLTPVSSPPPPQPSGAVPPPDNVAATPPPPGSSPAEQRSLSVKSPPKANGSNSAMNGSAHQAEMEKLKSENAELREKVERLHAFESGLQQAEASLNQERKQVQDLKDQMDKMKHETEVTLHNERQTVSLLVTEKANLISELQKLEEFESSRLQFNSYVASVLKLEFTEAQTAESLLTTEQAKARDLTHQVDTLKAEVQRVSALATQAEANEKSLSERFKDQERQLQIASASAKDFEQQAEESRRKLRELEEQIQNDDRIERLEQTLKNTQDRADNLEFQLTKLKQTHNTLKTEKERLESTNQVLSSKQQELTSNISTLKADLDDSRSKLSSIESERDELSKEKLRLEETLKSNEETIKELQEKLVQAAAAVATVTKQSQALQQEVRAATRRADEAERSQKSLQAEGTNLMQALDEMRPKIVELTGIKLELSEKIATLEHTVRNRDSVITQLENDLDEARGSTEEHEGVWKTKLAELEKRDREAQDQAAKSQLAYNELQEELETTLASLRSLESQRTNLHQDAARRLEEVERLTSLTRSQGEELDTLREQVETQREAHEEEQQFLERAQSEIETLRNEISLRDEELERLRQTAFSPGQSDAPRSLDDEMLGSLRQQHALEISAATSQIRALENTIFDKESANHALQKQINHLEEQLSKLRPHSRLAHKHSPVPSRPASRMMDNDLRRSSFGSHRPNPPALVRSVFENTMSPETMHKRKVSLSMLKARIDSEVKVSASGHGSQPPSRALSPVQSDGHSSRPPSRLHSQQVSRPQFLDESHVFWCHSCQGDLVIL
ncbi:hypothetical protein CVT24_003089, partial [Panaeolus cyanescens]